MYTYIYVCFTSDAYICESMRLAYDIIMNIHEALVMDSRDIAFDKAPEGCNAQTL